MPRFRFRLQTVLDQRQRVEDERQRDLAKLLRRRMILQNQLRQMQQTITESKRQLGSSLVGQVDMDGVARFARYSGQTTQRAQMIVVELGRLEKLIHNARQALLDASRKKKALELLRDRRYAQWKKQQDRREHARLDELNMQRYAMEMVH